MTKFKKFLSISALAIAAVSALAFGGCSETAETLGVYHYNHSEFVKITQGSLVRSYADSMAICSDDTFAASSVFDCYYSSDGEAYNPVSYLAYSYYGTYEVINEDADLGEMTIRITDVIEFQTGDSGSYGKEDFSEEFIELVNSEYIGREIILTSDYKVSENLLSVSIAQALSALSE